MFRCRRRGIGQLVESLHGKVDKVLTDLTALNNSVDALVANEAAVASELGALRDEVAQLSAGTITQEQIDNIAAKVTAVGEKLTQDVNAPDGGVGGTGGGEEAPAPPAEGEAPAGGEAPAPGGAAPPGEEAPVPAEGEQPPAGGETRPPAEG
jgi:outer membrane murein-binding lipoprotein Lpp